VPLNPLEAKIGFAYNYAGSIYIITEATSAYIIMRDVRNEKNWCCLNPIYLKERKRVELTELDKIVYRIE
jgi:hypothetical protein